MRRYFIYLCYDGSAYCGWQQQPNGLSVQEVVTKALSTLLRQPTTLTGAGRTDAGVHAAMMVAHFDASLDESTDSLTNKLNRLLPPDISVYGLREVCPEAHARFDATSRTYRYYVSTAKRPFARHYAYRLFHTPDFDLMNVAARHLLTAADFSSFCKVHTDARTRVCRVTRAEWSPLRKETGAGGEAWPESMAHTPSSADYVFTITADRFLRNMVRAVVGTLLEVGKGRLTPQAFADIIDRHDRCAAGTSVPAHALFLTDITYPERLFIKQ